jgi:DNA-binding GntR family transcriptional regulator
LEAQGLLVSLPRRGVRVALIDPAAVREVTEMRASLEALALGHAARSFSEADGEAAEQALKDAEASTDLIAWEEASRRFFRALVTPCGMPRLLSAIDDLHQTSARYLFAAWKEQDWPRADDERRALLEKMQARDADGAAGLLVSHILSTGRALAEKF